MKADDLFKKCGYNKVNDSIYTRYKASTHYDYRYAFVDYIGVKPNNCGVIVTYQSRDNPDIYFSKIIPVKQLKAIIQKCKELGWLEEEQ